jgi:4'-phosphopantetheinyl transferase EntD
MKDLYLPQIEEMTEKRRCEWLTVRLLLKEISGREREILYMPNGKPHLADNSFNISISHTGNRRRQANEAAGLGYAAVILNPERPVAIDIERISERIHNVKRRFMSVEELAAISKTDELVHLLLHWSAKETVFKLMDMENVDFQTQIHIFPFQPDASGQGSFEAKETRTERGEIFSIRYCVKDDYVITFAEGGK